MNPIGLDQPTASNMTKETRRMTSFNPRHSRCGIGALGLIALVCSAFVFAPSAGAAPSFTVSLQNDANELQRVSVNAGAGQFKLTFAGDTTSDLPVGASAAQVEAALNALPSIKTGTNDGFVSVTINKPEVGREEFFIDFNGGGLAHTDVPQITAASGTTPLTEFSSRVFTTTLDPAGVSRSDKRVDYLVNVKNTNFGAPVLAGDPLTCIRGGFTGPGNPSFTYQWLRNGAEITGATGFTYTASLADQGASIQCELTAMNTISNISDPSLFISTRQITGVTFVEPKPAIALPVPPPTPTSLFVAGGGSLDGTVDRNVTCQAGAWSGAENFVYQLFRNGSPFGAPTAPTAATSTVFTVTAAQQSPPGAFQCKIIATNTGGSTVFMTSAWSTQPPLLVNPGPPGAPDNERPFITSSPLSVEVELPAGQGTSVLESSGLGWNCTKAPPVGAQPAKATCQSETKNTPAGVYPTLVVSAGLGADTPDHAVATATALGGVAPVSDTDDFDFDPLRFFGLTRLDAVVADFDGNDYRQAGGHPYASSAGVDFPRFRSLAPGNFNYQYETLEHVKNVVADLPRGFVGNALAVPELCPGLTEVIAGTCPARSAVGGITLDLKGFGNGLGPFGIFAIEPEFGKPAQFAFFEGNSKTTYSFAPRLRADDGYAITLEATPVPMGAPLLAVTSVTLCSFGANIKTLGGGQRALNGCKKATDPTANPKPLVTTPTRCAGQPPTVRFSVDSWEDPGDFKSREFVNPTPTGCEKIDFQPTVSLKPTSQQADSPTGMDVEIAMPTEGLESPTGLAQANLDNAIVTFPKGMSINPSASHGLTACTPAQVKLGSNDDADCPLSSRVGTIEIETPLIRETLTGHVYVASQNDNPFKSTIGIYLVFSSKKDGVTVKVAGKLEPDPVTGQLTSSFVENPDLPFSRLAIKFNSGPRAPLINPPTCGTYAIHSELSPWSAASPANPTPEEIAAEDSVYQVTSGPNGGPCPTNALEPKLDAGLQRAVAGFKSPFVLKLSRDDGTQRFTGLDVSMPKGLTAYLKGVAYCPDHVLAAISGAEETGRPELANPACPAASRVGTVQAGAGAGPLPFYAPGKAYLAGPYKGAPVSIAIVTPAVAGPFDLGNVVVRNALYVDPVSAKVTVKSDPIPTILHGLMLDVRDIRVSVDRQGFTAAPTNCEPKSIGATIRGESGATVNRSNRFQVGDCGALGFRPKLALRLFGGAKRGAHPRLKATLTARAGDANIAGASVALPHSEFLDQAHIRTICTRVQFRANACPAGAIYGRAEAVTPLLDNPLSGPVYLRSSDNPLPDLVAVLRGPDSQPIEVVLAGRIDSVNGGIRSSFEAVPDQPVSSFTLSMQGGKKGLLVNSRNICKSVNKATAKFTGQNGKAITLRPVLQNSCKKAAKKHKRHR